MEHDKKIKIIMKTIEQYSNLLDELNSHYDKNINTAIEKLDLAVLQLGIYLKDKAYTELD